MIKVIQRGKVNCEFIVKNPKKILFWRMIASKVSGGIGLVTTEVIEL